MGLFNFLKRSSNKSLVKKEEKSLFNAFFIPEPTRSLIFVIDEDLSRRQNPKSYEISIEFDFEKGGVNSEFKDNKKLLYSEPSMIWTKLIIEENEETHNQPIYWPSYFDLGQKNRYQYLNWLKDITQKTNLSYVYLYFYGLERHLVLGNYILAAKEIIKLIKFHNDHGFERAAINSILAASILRNNFQIVDKNPFILGSESDLAIFMNFKNQKINPKLIMSISHRFGFTNKRYIKIHPDVFERVLVLEIQEYERKNGKISELINVNKIKKEEIGVFLNYSFPENIRIQKIPMILENKKLSSILKEVLINTHNKIKEMKSKSIKIN